MKQKSVKIGVMLVVVLMILAMFSTVALADNTALPPATGNLTIHKYIMDDVSQAALPNDGNPAGTGTNPAVPASAKPLNGITFNLYKITPNSATGALPGVGPYTLSGTTLTDGAGASFTVAAAATPSITTAGDSEHPATRILSGGRADQRAGCFPGGSVCGCRSHDQPGW